ncbi:MAG: Spy/CpxP family protein refolding chaperone [Methylobacter sp.]
MRKLLLILSLLPTIALANPPMPGELSCGDMPPPPPMHPMPMGGILPLPLILHQLNLTETQQGEINTLVKTHCREIGAKQETMKSAGSKIHRLTFSNDYSDDQIRKLFDQADVIHREIALQKSKLDNAIFKLLTKEQQDKLQSKMACFEG